MILIKTKDGITLNALQLAKFYGNLSGIIRGIKSIEAGTNSELMVHIDKKAKKCIQVRQRHGFTIVSFFGAVRDEVCT